MGAEQCPTPVDEGVVCYYLNPPLGHRSTQHRWSSGEVWWAIRESDWAQRAATTITALIGAILWTLLACIGLYCLYVLKSALGIDLIADQHLEDFVPIPGYHRW